MSCDTTCSVCLDQILEPDPPPELIILNAGGSLAVEEAGSLNIPQGVEIVSVTFLVQKLSAIYIFVQLEVENSVDAVPLDILAVPGSRAIGGFTVNLNGFTDTPNYRLLWKVQVTEA
jgi:hypothetical protein